MKLTDLKPEHHETGDIRVIVETPKGARIKFKYLPDHDLFAVNRVIPAGMLFPFNFGFIPSTLAEDGDPLDVLVLTTDPISVGCLVFVRMIGVIEGTAREKRQKTQGSGTDVHADGSRRTKAGAGASHACDPPGAIRQTQGAGGAGAMSTARGSAGVRR